MRRAEGRQRNVSNELKSFNRVSSAACPPPNDLTSGLRKKYSRLLRLIDLLFPEIDDKIKVHWGQYPVEDYAQ